MRKLILWSQHHPVLVIAFLLAVSALAATQLPSIKINASLKGMMIADDPDLPLYHDTLARFGTDNITIVYVEDEHLFTPEKLTALDDLAYRLEEIPGVLSVDSIFSANSFINDGGMLSSAPLVDWLPETQEEADALKQRALASPLLVRNIISPDGTAVALNIFVQEDPDNPDFDRDFSLAVDALIAEHSGSFDKAFQVGNSFAKRTIGENIMGDQARFVPFVALVIFLTLLLMMRTPNAPLLPALTAGTSILWTLGFMAFIGIPINMMTMIVPTLIIVIGSTEDIHLLSEYMEGLEHNGTPQKALGFMAAKCGTAVFLTALTTFLGFLSIAVNKIIMLRQFGIAAAAGLFINPLLTCMIAPIYLRFFGAKKPVKASSEHHSRGITALENFIIAIINGHKWRVFSGICLVTLLISLFTFHVQLDNDFLSFFKKDSEIRLRSNRLHEKICGTQPFFIRIDTFTQNAFKNPETLQILFDIQQFAKEKGWFDNTTSFADYITTIHCEMNGGNETFRTIPDDPNLISQYLLFLNRSDIERFVLADYSSANIIVRHNITSSHELNAVLEELRAYIASRIPKNFQAGITGEHILVNSASDSMSTGQAQSLSLLIVIIFIIMSVLFMNFKAGLLSIIPNLIPILLLFGFMGLFGITLNAGTVMVAAIAIGIALDDTIHFMTRYHKEMKTLQCQNKAMEVCIRSELKPVLSTSLALALGFSVMCFASFVPIIHFGALSAIVILFALMGDLFITPILLTSTQLITIWDLVALHLDNDVIKKSTFFRGLKKWQIKKLISLGNISSAEKGARMISQGEMGRTMFLLLEGSVNVQSKETHLATLTAGEVFGEIALLNPGPRSADVVADEPVQYIEIDWQRLENMRKRFPAIFGQVALNLASILGQRLVEADRKLTGDIS
jgi:predicted RND superfamily exporter protein